MKPHRIMGVVAAVTCVVVGIIILSPLSYFFDATSVVLVVVGSVAMVAVTYGRASGRLLSALGGWFFGAESDAFSSKEHREIAEMAIGFGQYALLTGAVGMLIGQVHMLVNMTDPSAIGPALAVSLLTVFYGGVAHMVIAVPVSQHHLIQAGADASELNHKGAGLRLLTVLGLCTGMSFFVMLLAMSDGFS